MTSPLKPTEKILVVIVVLLSLGALWLATLAPGFSYNNNLVYGGF